MKHTIDQEAREYFAMMRERNAYRDIIPELVDVIDYKLGVYYAEQGDFGSAGGAEFHLLKRMERHFKLRALDF